MDDALLVRGFERLGDLLRDRQRFVERNRSARDALRQVLAFDQLHHQARVPLLLDAVDVRDVRMIERREHFRFALEPRQPIAIVGDVAGRTLIATSRFSFESRARYTSPMPPAPSCSTTSYGPIRVPVESAVTTESSSSHRRAS